MASSPRRSFGASTPRSATSEHAIPASFAGRSKNAIHRALAAQQQTLLGHVAAGDPAAVRQCISTYGPLVWSIARRLTPNEVVAEEAVTQIFVELWNHAGRFDPNVTSEAVFITILARRHLLDRLRRTEHRAPPRPADALVRDELRGVSEQSPEARVAASVLVGLDPRQRHALSLALGQGMSHEDIAELTGMPLREVRSLTRRTLVAVRKRLPPPGGPP